MLENLSPNAYYHVIRTLRRECVALENHAVLLSARKFKKPADMIYINEIEALLKEMRQLVDNLEQEC